MNRVINGGFDFYQEPQGCHRTARIPPQSGWRYPYHPDAYQVSYTPANAGIYNMYLYGPIEDAEQFIPAIEALDSAGEYDVFRIYLSTDGGSLDATDTFLNALQRTAARVVVFASGGVHSAGTVILLHADEFHLSDKFNALIHNGGCGSGGKFSDFKAHAEHNVKYMESVMRDTYAGFLDDDEIDALLAGKDFWLDADQFLERAKARGEYLHTKEVVRRAIEEDEQDDEDEAPVLAKTFPRKPRGRKQKETVATLQ